MDNNTCVSCVHCGITGKEAENLLLQQGVDGSFLVRTSSCSPNEQTLSVRRKNQIVHLKIQNYGDYIDLYGGNIFPDLQSLIRHYITATGDDVLTEKNGNLILLKYPLKASEFRVERWFHSNISRDEAETMLKLKNEEGYFLVSNRRSIPNEFYVSCLYSDGLVFNVPIKCKNGKYFIVPTDGFNTLVDLIKHHKNHPISVKLNNNVYSFYIKEPLNMTAVPFSKLNLRISELLKCDYMDKDGFYEEFEKLKISEENNQIYLCQVVGMDPINKLKNRYKNIIPYDNSRVILKDVNKMLPHSDYINASYITAASVLPKLKKQYIATQGCTKHTVADFWNMVWQEEVNFIAMITKITENEKNKCYLYWPETEKQELELDLFSGKIVIKMQSQTNKTFYFIRIFEIVFGKEKRLVTHYQYENWFDKLTPIDTRKFINFISEIKKYTSSIKAPLLVHCSAGIGRSGTFIMIDMILNYIDIEGLDSSIDIFKLLLHIRKQRAGLVQTAEQYKFIYLSVQDYINSLTTNVFNCNESTLKKEKDDSKALYSNISEKN